MVKESKRIQDTHGWAYAEFAYDGASDAFALNRNDANWGREPQDSAGKGLHFAACGHR
jgi:hypothetical protein